MQAAGRGARVYTRAHSSMLTPSAILKPSVCVDEHAVYNDIMGSDAPDHISPFLTLVPHTFCFSLRRPSTRP